MNSIPQVVKQENFVHWHMKRMHGGWADTTVIPFNSETWFQLSGYVKSQNNRFPTITHKVPLHDVLWLVYSVLWVQLVLMGLYFVLQP